MESNSIFNIQRFVKYLASDLKRCVANFGVSFLVITLTGVFAYLIIGVISMATGSGWVSANALARAIFMCISAVVLIIIMPEKCYGFITDKRRGASWLMLPVSTTEKFVSMLVNTLIIIPAAFIGGALLLDFLIVVLDPNLDTTVIVGIKEVFDVIAVKAATESEVNSLISENIANGRIFLTSIDDGAMSILIFLLGALYFKKNKAAKTILAWLAVASVISVCVSPLMLMITGNIDMDTINAIGNGDIEAATRMANGFVNKAVIFDVILDTALMIGAATGIFFRIKTIKH